MKTVVETKETTLDNVTTKKVYGFVGSNNELYILGRKPDGNYFFNSINKTGKPVNEYSSLEEALKDKMDNGFDILEFEGQEDIARFILDYFYLLPLFLYYNTPRNGGFSLCKKRTEDFCTPPFILLLLVFWRVFPM